MSNGQTVSESQTSGGVSKWENQPARRGRRGRRVLVWVGLGLVAVILLLVVLAPTIGSAMAPGIIEGSVNPGIKGRVDVGRASIGWFSGLRAGPVEVFDPNGDRVVMVSVTTPVTAWQALTGRYWAARRLDLGEVEVKGDVDIRQYLDGTTSLDRALAPRDPASKPSKPSGGSGGSDQTPAVKATVKVTELDVTVRNEADQFKNEIGIKGFRGQAVVDADPSAAGGGVVKAVADFTGQAVATAAGPNAGQDMSLKLDADLKQKASGGSWSPAGLERAKLKLGVTSAPMAVVDALASMGGALVQGVGDTADVNVDLDGNAEDLSGRVQLTSAGLNADANVSVKDGVLRAAAEQPATVSLKSTAFVENLPQAREGVAQAAQQIRLSTAPSVQLVLERLSVPLPKDTGAGVDLKTLDLRGATVGARVRVSEMAGQVKLANGGGGAAAPANAAAGDWKPFTVEPIELALNIEDLSKPVNIQTGTKATLDGQPAGDIQLSLSAEGLLNKDGRLRAVLGGDAGYADRASALARLSGVSTALLQPVIAGAIKDLPVVLSEDVGPTLDVVLAARADVGGVTNPGAVGQGVAALPPADIEAQVNSNNIKADVKARLDKGVLTSTGDGIRLSVERAAPLAQRIIAASQPAPAAAAPGQAAAAGGPPVMLSGPGRVELIARELTLPLGDTRPEAVIAQGRGDVRLTVSDVNAAMNMGGNTSPVRIERHVMALTLTPGAGPKVGVDGRMQHENQSFTVAGEYTLAGLTRGMPKSKGPGVLAEVNPTGEVSIKGLPRSLLAIVPATAGYASGDALPQDATEMTRAIAAMVREAVGPSMDVSLRMLPAEQQAGGGQLVQLNVETASKGAGVDTWLRVAATEAEVRLVNSFVKLTPASVDPVLAAISAPKPGEVNEGGQAPAAANTPMRLGAPSTLWLVVDKPVKLPLVAGPNGAVTPDWSKAGVLEARAAVESDLVVSNIAVASGEGGAARPTVLALREVKADVAAPLAGVPNDARANHRASVKMTAQALNRTSGEASIAKLLVDASAMMDGSSPEAAVTVDEVGTAAVGDLLAKRDLLVGAIGDQAKATLVVKPGQKDAAAVGEVIGVVLEVTSPRISGAKISLAKDDQRLWLTAPSTVTWTPNIDMLNRALSAGKSSPATESQGIGARLRREVAPPAAGAAPTLSLEQMQPVTVNIEKLGLSMGGGQDAAGQATSGPLKPGVFEIGLTARAPGLTAVIPPQQAGQGPTKLPIEGVAVSVTSPKAAAGATSPNPLELNLNIDRVGGGGAAAGKKSSARIQVQNLANAAGVVNADQAVINADVDIDSFPTLIVDKLASQGGVLNELLGPTVTLVAQGRNVSTGGGAAASGGNGGAIGAGNLSMQATSPRATAELKGDVRAGQFVQNGPVKVTLREIRTELVQLMAGSVPIVETLQKIPPDDPATIETTSLTAPLDGDMRKLNGRVAVDMGIARFTTSSLLGDLIKGLGGRESGSIGKKVEPFVVNIKDGVATYDRFRLPVGEFFLETRGTVDLVRRQIDVVTYAPIGALTDKAIGKLGAPVVGRLNEVLQVPFTTKGSMDDPQRLYPDVGLFLKEAGENLIKDPGKIIGDVIGDVFKPKEPKK